MNLATFHDVFFVFLVVTLGFEFFFSPRDVIEVRYVESRKEETRKNN